MTEPETYSFRRYLEAKRTVDDRAFNRRVLDRVQDELLGSTAPLRVVEVGAGIGAMIERVLEWQGLPTAIEYTAVDSDQSLVETAFKDLQERTAGTSLAPPDREGVLSIEDDSGGDSIEFIVDDAFDFLEGTVQQWDLLIAHSFLDLTDVRTALRTFNKVVVPDGLLYFPITFDGGTHFHPVADPELDDRIERRYHRHIGSREGVEGVGDSRAGRHLLHAIPDLGGRVVAAGGSDWIVTPGPGGYPGDEAYFLHHIIEMIRGALTDDPDIDPDRVREWIARRHHHVDAGRLVYITHQLDIASRPP